MVIFLGWWNASLDIITLPETNIAPENWWLEDYFPFRKANVQGARFFVLGRVNHHLVCIVLLFFSKHQSLWSSIHAEQGPTKDHLTETSLAFLDVPKTSGFGRGKRVVFTFTGFLFFDFWEFWPFFFRDKLAGPVQNFFWGDTSIPMVLTLVLTSMKLYE